MIASNQQQAALFSRTAGQLPSISYRELMAKTNLTLDRMARLIMNEVEEFSFILMANSIQDGKTVTRPARVRVNVRTGPASAKH